MKPITLALYTEAGDELGRVDVPELAVKDPGGTPTSSARPDLTAEMADLLERIQAVLAAQGVAAIHDPLDLQIVVGRALLQPDAGEIVIPLVVRPLVDSAVEREPTTNLLTTEAGAWDDLFDLTRDVPTNLEGRNP
jgi:hypothetical protein